MDRFHELEIKQIKKESNDAVSIMFDVPANLKVDYAFKAGQYLDLKTQINGEEIIRSYSIWKAPHENELSVLVKKVEDGIFSTYANQSLKEGDKLSVSLPEGNFMLKHEKELVFVAAGSGITPILAMVKNALKDSGASVTLFFANKTSSDIIFKSEIDNLKEEYSQRFNKYYLLTRENVSEPILKGRINKEKCESLLNENLLSLNAGGYYLCGPEEMIFSVKDFLVDKGVKEDVIRFELFKAPTNQENKEETEVDTYSGNVSVSMIIDDDEFEFMYDPSSSESILEAGIENGVDLPFSCKGGVCCTCKAKITNGKAKMRVNYALTDDEVEEGYVLTCQSHATTGAITVDYDE